MRLYRTAEHGRTGDSDMETVRVAGEILSGRSKRGVLARLLPFQGPAFIASVAYVDRGNDDTNIQSGAQLGIHCCG
jgi:manganese transport protein